MRACVEADVKPFNSGHKGLMAAEGCSQLRNQTDHPSASAICQTAGPEKPGSSCHRTATHRLLACCLGGGKGCASQPERSSPSEVPVVLL